MDTLFLTFTLTLIFLLGKTHVSFAVLCGIYFQSVTLTWISLNKRASIRKSVRNRVPITLLLHVISDGSRNVDLWGQDFI